jgi:ferredoxin
MKVRLDADACVGHGRCYAIAPEVFDADDQGHSVVLFPDEPVPVALHDQARQAIANCPERALAADVDGVPPAV